MVLAGRLGIDVTATPLMTPDSSQDSLPNTKNASAG
jgi:hypothetical protein